VRNEPHSVPDESIQIQRVAFELHADGAQGRPQNP
jgi:hypothetical protein